MKKNRIFLCFFTFFLFLSRLIAQEVNLALQKELIEMCEIEQALRLKWIGEKDLDVQCKIHQEIIALDAAHLPRLQAIFITYGWPGFALVGTEGSHAFWLLVQHTPDFVFQTACLEALETSVRNQDASPGDLAFLTDRVNVRAGKKQIYGTQLDEQLNFYPIEEEEHVDARRAEMGLSTLEEYLSFIHQIYQSNFEKSD